MNKLFMLIAGILLLSIVIGGGGVVVTTLTAKNVDIVYPEIKTPEVTYTKPQMLDFNDVKYEVRGNTIILNKTNLFQNREVPLIENQTCTNWNEPQCIEYSIPNCLSWSEPTCLTWEERKPIQCLKLENPEEPFNTEKNPCIEWEDYKTIGCLEFDAKKGICNKWEKELECLEMGKPECLEYEKIKCLKYSEKTCTTWTKYTREEFIQQAIKKEIEFVKGIQITRTNKTPIDINTTGKIQIK